MELREYLFRFRITQKEFMEKTGICQGTLSNAINQKEIRLAIAKKIEMATGGLVQCKELGQPIKEDIPVLHSTLKGP